MGLPAGGSQQRNSAISIHVSQSFFAEVVKERLVGGGVGDKVGILRLRPSPGLLNVGLDGTGASVKGCECTTDCADR